MKPNTTEFLRNIKQYVSKDRIYTDDLRCLAWGTDAGFYRLVPQVVVRSRNVREVQQVLRAATAHRVPVTFRAAGTSLSGQAISDSVLLVAGKNWENYEFNDDASVITLEPGILVDTGVFCIEENYVITEDGYERLSTGSRKLHQIRG